MIPFSIKVRKYNTIFLKSVSICNNYTISFYKSENIHKKETELPDKETEFQLSTRSVINLFIIITLKIY
jgi:hypothetical protein